MDDPTLQTFVVVTLVYAALALWYPVSLIWKLKHRPEDLTRWLKATPTFTLYLPFVFSMGAGLLVAFLPWNEILDIARSPSKGALAGIVLLSLLGLAFFAVVEDLRRPLVEPFMFKESEDLLQRERELRNRLRQRRPNDSRATLVAQYAAEATPLKSINGLWRRGSSCAWASFSLNLLAAETIALLFWYLGMCALFKIPMDRPAMAATVGLFCLWFPIRLYAEWYLNFNSFKGLKLYWAFLFILIAAVFAYGFLAFGTGGVGEVLSLGVGLLLAVIGVLAKFKPQWLEYVAQGIDEMPARWFIAMSALVLIALLCMVGGMLLDDEPAPTVIRSSLDRPSVDVQT